jgi:2Fe-2S ferredoxin
MTFIERDGSPRELHVRDGQTLLEIAHEHGIDIEGACEGAMACSTCHVIVDDAWIDRLPEPCEDEEDMLDLAAGLTQNSRLGCQVEVSDALDGLVVRLPRDVRNMLLS